MKPLLKHLGLSLGILHLVQASSWAVLPEALSIDWILECYERGEVPLESVLRVTRENIRHLSIYSSGSIDLFNQLKEHRISPDWMIYNRAIHAYAVLGKGESAYALLHEMKRHGLPTTLITYSNVIHAYAQSGNHERAYGVFQEMRENGIFPDESLYQLVKVPPGLYWLHFYLLGGMK